jgi:hypothetical protein
MANEYGNYSTIDPLNTRTTTNTHVASQALTNGNRTTAITVADAHQAYTQTLSPGGKYHVEQTCGTWGSDDNGGHAIMILCPKTSWEGSTTGPAVVTSAFAFHARKPGGSGFGPITRLSGSNLTTLGTEVANGNRVTYDIDMSTIGSTTVKISIEGSLISTDSSMAFADEEYVMAFNVDNVARSIDFTMNTGSDAFVDTPVTGHVAVSTATQSTPDVINYEDEYYIEAGISHSNGSTTAVTLPTSVSGGAMARIKRTDSTGDWYVVDTVRGANKFFKWNSSAVEDTSTFDDQNLTGTTLTLPSDLATGTYLVEVFYVGSYFQIKTYTGTGSAHAESFPGTLDTAPGFMAFANRTTSRDMKVYHISTTATAAMNTQENTASTTNSIWFNDTEPTTTQFTVGTYVGVNTNTDNHVMYAWANSGPYAFGSYIGNSNASGPVISMNGSPASTMIKRSSATENWLLLNALEPGYNLVDNVNYLNLTNAMAVDHGTTRIDILSNGAKVRGTNTNINNGTYIYGAFGIQPMTDGSVNQGRAR